MVNYNPHIRIMELCKTIMPSILRNYKENGWDYQESLEILDRNHTIGLGLSETFDDNVEALESLDTCYGKVRDFIEAEHLERLSTEAETLYV